MIRLPLLILLMTALVLAGRRVAIRIEMLSRSTVGDVGSGNVAHAMLILGVGNHININAPLSQLKHPTTTEEETA